MDQLSGRNSLRDIVDNMSAQMYRLYPFGSNKLLRSSLLHTNEEKSLLCIKRCLENIHALLRRCILS